ncbi:MAG: hypothetical protein J6A04_04555 [Clostridia bacterium]|nr:hypothetical protein [Clostridia bacterium]
MKKEMTLEDAISRGYNSRKVMQMAREELGVSATRRRTLSRIREVEQNTNSHTF